MLTAQTQEDDTKEDNFGDKLTASASDANIVSANDFNVMSRDVIGSTTSLVVYVIVVLGKFNWVIESDVAGSASDNTGLSNCVIMSSCIIVTIIGVIVSSISLGMAVNCVTELSYCVFASVSESTMTVLVSRIQLDLMM